MATQDAVQVGAVQGMTFDSTPVSQDTPAQAPDSGMTFDSAPVNKDTAADQLADSRTPEEQAFLKANPDHVYLRADPKFPNRPEGVYPTGKGNEWRQNPSYSQSPVDLHFAEHTAEGAAAGAAAAAPAMGLGYAPELVELAIKHLAGNVLPGMEEQAAKEKLIQMAPKVLQIVKEWALPVASIGGLIKVLTMNSGKL